MKINKAMITVVLLTIVGLTGCTKVPTVPHDIDIVEPSWGKEYLRDYDIKAIGESNGSNPTWLLDGKVIGTGWRLEATACDSNFTIGEHTLELATTFSGETSSSSVLIKIQERPHWMKLSEGEEADNIYTHIDTVTGLDFEVNREERTVTHIESGVMFLKDEGDMYTFKGARKYIKYLNQSKHLGYSNWRLPKAKELALLFKVHTVKGETLYHPVDLKTIDARIGGVYWSCTKASDGLDGETRAHVFQMFDGNNAVVKVRRKPSLLSRPRYVIPVRTLEM